jgi:hypothetical protein
MELEVLDIEVATNPVIPDALRARKTTMASVIVFARFHE